MSIERTHIDKGVEHREEKPYRGPGWRAIRRSRVEGGLSEEQVAEFRKEFSELKVGTLEYRRLLQRLSKKSRAGRVKSRIGQ